MTFAEIPVPDTKHSDPLAGESLEETREQLRNNGISPENVLRIESENWHDAYFEIGTEFAENIKRTFIQAIEDQAGDGESTGDHKIDIARKLAVKLTALAEDESGLGANVRDLINSLNGWAEGSGLVKIAAEHGLTSLEGALILENDNLGCQSFIARTKDHGIVLLHTEEDATLSSRVTGHHMIEMKVGGEKKSTFSYNNILPGGAAVGESEGFIMATDFLRLNTMGQKNGFTGLANTAAWIIWKMGKDAAPEDVKNVLEKLGPFSDGYAINIARRKPDGTCEGVKYLFAGDAYYTETLGDTPGDHFEQTNLLDPAIKSNNERLFGYSQVPFSQPPTSDKLPEGYYENFLKRIRRIEHAASIWSGLLNRDMAAESDKDIHETAARILSIRTKDNWGFANNTVAATFSGYIGGSRQTSAVGVGPSSRNVKADELLISNF